MNTVDTNLGDAKGSANVWDLLLISGLLHAALSSVLATTLCLQGVASWYLDGTSSVPVCAHCFLYWPPLKRGSLHLLCILPSGINRHWWNLPQSHLFSRPNTLRTLIIPSEERCSKPSFLPSVEEKQICSLSYSGLSCTAGPRTRHSTQNAGSSVFNKRRNLSWPDGNTLSSAAENPTGILSIKDTFLAYIQLAFNQDFPVLFCKDTLRWMSPSKHQCLLIVVPSQIKDSALLNWLEHANHSTALESYVKSLDPVILLMKLKSLFNVNFCFFSIGWFSSIIHHCKPYTIWNNSSVTRRSDYSHFCVF